MMRIFSAVILVTLLGACGGGDDGDGALLLSVTTLAEAKVTGSRVSLDFNVKTSAGNPVPGLSFPANFKVLEDGQMLGAVNTPTVGANPQSFRALTLLLVDVSKANSLVDANLDMTRGAVKTFAASVIGESGGNRQLAIYLFAGGADPTKLIDFTSDLVLVNNTLDAQLTCANAALCIDIARNLNGAIVKGIDLLKTARMGAEASGLLTAGALAAFSGGVDSASRVSEGDTLGAIQSSSNKSSVFVVSLGAQTTTDAAVLTRYGKDGYFNAADIGGLAAAFQSIAERVNGFANSFYRMQYCTAKRSQRHTVELRVSYTDAQKVAYQGTVQATFNATDSISCVIQ